MAESRKVGLRGWQVMPKAQLRLMLKDLPSCPKSYWNHPSKKAEKLSSAFEKKQGGCGLLTKKVAKKKKFL
jgi:hypothetical protein